MKTINTILIFLCLILASSCDIFNLSAEGELRIHYSDDFNKQYTALTEEYLDSETKAVGETIPHPNDFILEITDPKGNEVYSGKFGACPESVFVKAGSYNISVRSCDFEAPAFAKPQFGDEQCVVVSSGGVSEVKLNCTQLNSGVRLSIDKDFLTEYPEGVFFVKNADSKLMYSYSEKRIAYFSPGSISVILSNESKESVLLTRNLKKQEVLNLRINVLPKSSGTSGELSVALDTSRVWLEESYTIGDGSSSGGGNNGNQPQSAMSVAKAKENIGSEDVWVFGYIVGGDMTSGANGISFEVPFSSATNIAIADRSSVKDKNYCLSVQLSSGDLRDALNLKENPENLGKMVYLKGNIVEAYYGIPGIKSISEYILE